MEELSRSVAQTKAGRSRESALKTQILVKDMKIEELEEQVNLLRTQLDTVNQALSAGEFPYFWSCLVLKELFGGIRVGGLM